jgi:hypothetical protein
VPEDPHPAFKAIKNAVAHRVTVDMRAGLSRRVLDGKSGVCAAAVVERELSANRHVPNDGWRSRLALDFLAFAEHLNDRSIRGSTA